MQKDPDIILYGGSFDPPHLGHVQLIELMLEEFPKSKVVVLVSPQAAAAGGGAKTHHVGWDQRIAMLELALGSLTSQVEFSDVEKNSESKINFTYQTVERFRQDNPDKSLAFLVGQDQFASFDEWKNPKEILTNAMLIVVSRKGASRSLSEDLEKVANKLELPLGWEDVRCAKLGGQRVYLLNEDLSEAASKEIKRRYLSGEDCPEAWMSLKVKHYIEENNLYERKK